MANASVVIYNAAREPVADLNQAFDVGYEQRINELHRAWFSLPYDDPHISECTGLRYAEIYNGDERVDLFRIIKKAKRGTSEKLYYRFECEHVFTTLINDKLKTSLSSGPGTATTIADILALQGTVNWALGSSDFARQFLYRWETGTSLLECLLDVPARFGASYQWTFDTSSYPWTVNLIEPPATVSSYLDRGRNLLSVNEDEDYTQIVTRIYPYGAGSGADQLDITGIEPSGNAYLSNNVAKYTLIEKIWTDQRYLVAQNLYDAAVDIIAEYSVPRVKYDVTGADLYSLTGESIDKFSLGDLVEVTYDDIDISVEARIVGITKKDVNGAPGDVAIQIANKAVEFDYEQSVSTNDLANVQMVNIPGGIFGALPSVPSAAGLYASTEYFGFSDGTNWRAYFDINGKFQLVGDATHYLTFDPDAVTPLIIHADGEWLGSLSISQLTAGNLAVQMNLTAGGSVKSTVYTPGSAGWQIHQDGSAEFSNVTVRGVIDAGAGSDVAWSYISAVSISTADIGNLQVTNAKIATLAVDKLTAGDLSVEANFVAGGSMKSDNYAAGSAGWQIRNNGSAEFRNVTVRGDLDADDLSTGSIDFATIGRTGMSVIAAEIAAGAVTNAKIDTMEVDKLTAGDLSVECNFVAGGLMKSDNYVAGTTGWKISNDGKAEFRNVTVRGDLDADDLSTGSIDFATIGRTGMSVIAAEIAAGAVTNAKIDTMEVDKLTAGDLSVEMNLTTGGSVKSDNYSAGSAGWQIHQDGSAEFQNVTIRGTLVADDIDSGTLVVGGGTAATLDINATVDFGNQSIYNLNTLRGGTGTDYHIIYLDNNEWIGYSASPYGPGNSSYLLLNDAVALSSYGDLTIDAQGGDLVLKANDDMWFQVGGGAIAKLETIVASDSLSFNIGHEGYMKFTVGTDVRYLAFRRT